MHAQWPRQALLEKQGQAELDLRQMASSYTPVYPIACHLFFNPYILINLRKVSQGKQRQTEIQSRAPYPASTVPPQVPELIEQKKPQPSPKE